MHEQEKIETVPVATVLVYHLPLLLLAQDRILPVRRLQRVYEFRRVLVSPYYSLYHKVSSLCPNGLSRPLFEYYTGFRKPRKANDIQGFPGR